MSNLLDNKVNLDMVNLGPVSFALPGSDTAARIASTIWSPLGRGSVLSALFFLSVSCATNPTDQADVNETVNEVWMEVPETSPTVPLPTTPQPVPTVAPPSSRLAESELPLIEPLQQPLNAPAQTVGAETTTSTLEKSAEQSQAVLATATDKQAATQVVPQSSTLATTSTSGPAIAPTTTQATAQATTQAITQSNIPAGADALTAENASADTPANSDVTGGDTLAASQVVENSDTSLAPITVLEMTDGDTEIGRPTVPPVAESVAEEAEATAVAVKSTEPPTDVVVPAGAATNVAISDIELLCNEVIAGLPVSNIGCAILDASIEGVGFLPDSADLSESAIEVLDSVAREMEKNENLRVSVSTHSHDLDDSALGKLQSRRRTLSVIRHLIAAGIEASRVRPNTAPLEFDDLKQADISQYLVVLRTVNAH